MSVQERKTATAGIAVAGLPGQERVYAVRNGEAVSWDALVAAGATELKTDGIRRHGRSGLFDGALDALGIWPSKIRRRIPGVRIDSGLVEITGCSEFPVIE